MEKRGFRQSPMSPFFLKLLLSKPISDEISNCPIEEGKGGLCALLIWLGGYYWENIIISKLGKSFEEIMLFFFLNRKTFPGNLFNLTIGEEEKIRKWCP